MIRKNSLFILLLIFFTSGTSLLSQSKVEHVLQWTKSNDFPQNSTFKEAAYLSEHGLPYYSNRFPTKNLAEITFEVVDFKSEPLTYELEANIQIPSRPKISASVVQERKNFMASYRFLPFIKNPASGQVERITQITLQYTLNALPNNMLREGPPFKNASALRDGEIYKIPIPKSGMYKITKANLDDLDIDLGDFDPRNIQILGNPGGMNPEPNATFRYDDLLENAIQIQGEEDGSFDSGDFILFYAHGPHAWEDFEYEHNLYEDQNYYFLKLGSERGKRIEERPSLSVSNYSSTADTYKRYEIDEYNLLADFSATQGSGKLWFSDKFKNGNTKDYSSLFADPHMDLSEPVKFEIQAAGRSATSSKLRLNIDNVSSQIQFNGVSVANIESTYADLEKRNYTQQLSSREPQISVFYESTSGEADAWIDYLHMEYRRNLVYENNEQFTFRNREDGSEPQFGYQFSDFQNGLSVWDITDADQVKSQEIVNGRFGYNSNGIHEFVVFDPSTSLFSIESAEKVENQNLHSLTRSDMVIIYHPEFRSAAERLASHRADFNDYSVTTIPVEQIYNEFSSGRVDVVAIRDFARMLYQRDNKFRYLSLIGDGSYDYKHRDDIFRDESFIPVFETANSMHPINAFPSDDFYALLDEQEGDDLKGGLDIAVGRIPAKTAREADIVVDKIIAYDTDQESLSDWRLRIGFVADDEDRNVHLNDSDGIAEDTRKKYDDFNVEKIYFDAFPQVSTPGGERYPQATEALYTNLFKGMLTLCYLGHGGPKGWAQERVLKREDVAGWNNKEKLPLMITATCSFTGFDNPADVSAGEVILFEEDGGAVGLMSTVRAVYVNRNRELTASVFDTIFSKVDGVHQGIGEILRRAKNSNARDTVDVNARKFLLIGDPALQLAVPSYDIKISSLNGKLIDETYTPDTIGALQRVTFEGFIADEAGNVISDFNGKVSASVFDKLIKAKTLANNPGVSLETTFNLQKTILFKGQSKVENGKFAFDFYLPSDINFEFGNGKISLYAENGEEDASGRFDNFIIGGSNEGVQDENPPLVDVFLNDEDFAFGGISNTEPVLLVKLQDDYGINVAGVSVGHDLTAELDNNSQERFILNDFYEADLNDSRRGTVRFPLKDIEPGKHTVKIRAWDLSNNLGEGYTEFIVVDDLEAGLEHVFNYPNPFSTQTFFQFEHNLPGTELEIIIQIHNMSGQIVKTLEHMVIDDGFRIDDIRWDGLDDYGQKIANGVYLYKINVYANQLGIKKESKYEKLVILK